MINEKDILGVVVFTALVLLISAAVTGCSFKIETLYHGQTPVGIDDRKATVMRAAPAAQVRTVKLKDEDRD